MQWQRTTKYSYSRMPSHTPSSGQRKGSDPEGKTPFKMHPSSCSLAAWTQHPPKDRRANERGNWRTRPLAEWHRGPSHTPSFIGEEGEGRAAEAQGQRTMGSRARKNARAARDLSRSASTQAQAQSTYLALVAAMALLPWMMMAPVVRSRRRGRSEELVDAHMLAVGVDGAREWW